MFCEPTFAILTLKARFVGFRVYRPVWKCYLMCLYLGSQWLD